MFSRKEHLVVYAKCQCDSKRKKRLQEQRVRWSMFKVG